MSHGPPIRRLSDWPAERLLALADRHGTPLYVLDLERVRENGSRLQSAFPDAHCSYAVKANSTRAVLETIHASGLDAECASAGETQRALEAGFPGDRIRYTAVNPPAADLDQIASLAADQEFTVTFGAVDTLDRLLDRGFAGSVCVRVNPGVGAGHHEKVRTGDAPQFGVPFDRVPALCARIRDREPTLALAGLHAHAGSGISGDGLEAHRALVEGLASLAGEIGGLSFVSVGGGFGVPYRPSEPPLDLDAVAETTRDAFGDCDAQLAIEPGRYLLADAGVLLTDVTTVKRTPDTTVVGVDAGMTTLARPALYDAHHELRLLNASDESRPSINCLVAGPICETADVLGRDRTLPKPECNETIAVGNAGAYGYEMASQYNSRPRPAVVSIEGTTLVRRETVADCTRLEHSIATTNR
ncbi:diaminopimelate decarboxylase [Halocatena halophila]|uniref:diaminopimelate decarboxylase n=1 Tax=Halocatena halophila TaxID=2814576 RepID=UPI002ED5528D